MLFFDFVFALSDMLCDKIENRDIWLYRERNKLYITGNFKKKSDVDIALHDSRQLLDNESQSAKVPLDMLLLKLLKCEPCMHTLRKSVLENDPSTGANHQYYISKSCLWVFNKFKIDTKPIRAAVYANFVTTCHP